jgi:hypothetical protein
MLKKSFYLVLKDIRNYVRQYKLVNAQNTHSVADFIKQGLFLTNLERYITQFLTWIEP